MRLTEVTNKVNMTSMNTANNISEVLKRTGLTAAGLRVLETAVRRSAGSGRLPYVFPMYLGHAAAMAVYHRLQRQGFVSHDPAPVVTDKGRAILAEILR